MTLNHLRDTTWTLQFAYPADISTSAWILFDCSRCPPLAHPAPSVSALPTYQRLRLGWATSSTHMLSIAPPQCTEYSLSDQRSPAVGSGTSAPQWSCFLLQLLLVSCWSAWCYLQSFTLKKRPSFSRGVTVYGCWVTFHLNLFLLGAFQNLCDPHWHSISKHNQTLTGTSLVMTNEYSTFSFDSVREKKKSNLWSWL